MGVRVISAFSVIIDDFNIGRAGRAVGPFEADPPLVVDTNAVLPFTVTAQGFETVARQTFQVLQIGRVV